MAHAIDSTSHSPADDLRNGLEKAERQVVSLNAANIEEFLVLLDRIERMFEEFALSLADMRPEQSRWDSILSRISSKPVPLVRAARAAGGLATLRADHPPAENFWWHLDVEVATRRRKAITRFVVTTLLVIAAVGGGLWGVDKMFPPDARAVALLNTNSALDPYIAEHRWNEALQVIEEAKVTLPNEPELYIWEGVLAEQAGDPERAQRALAHARDLLPGQTKQFWILVGNRRMQIGNLDGAVAAANEALAIDPNDPQAHFLLGGVAEAKGDTQTAIAEFNLVFDLAQESDPQLAVIARVRMGTLLQQVNPFPETPITPTLAVSVTGTITATLTPGTP